MHAPDELILQRVGAVISETFRVPPGFRIVRETTSADIEGWDSLSYAVLIMKMEETFGLDLPLDRVYALADVGQLADLLRELEAGKKGS